MKLYVVGILVLCAVSVMAVSCPGGNMDQCGSMSCLGGYVVKCVNQICTCVANIACSDQKQCINSGLTCNRVGGWHCADNKCVCGNCV